MTQMPPQAPPQAPIGVVPNPGKGLSIAGMVLGIVGLALFCLWYLAIPCAIVGLILSILGKKKSKAANAPTGMATAGIVLSIIALALDLVFAIIAIIALTAVSNLAKDPNFMQRMHQMLPLLPF